MRLCAFPKDDESLRRQAAELLVEAFPHENGWPTLERALEEVDEALVPARRCRAAIDVDGRLLGWVGATSGYRGRVWELHPLVVRAAARGRGIGRQLTTDLEHTLGREGALTIYVGTDDDHGETSLAGVDLYPTPLDALRELSEHREIIRLVSISGSDTRFAALYPMATAAGYPASFSLADWANACRQHVCSKGSASSRDVEISSSSGIVARCKRRDRTRAWPAR